MKQVANLSRSEREELFIATAHDIHLPEAMVEKDFWVCWTLDYLFHACPWIHHLAFKGGTSLSKCYHLIERFSEDIDLILDWRLLGCEKDVPWQTRSNTKQDKFNKKINADTESFLLSTFLPVVQNDFESLLSDGFELSIDRNDPQTVLFAYPRIFGEGSILPMVRMEIGALAAWSPVQNMNIFSYAAKQYPKVFHSPGTQVLTVAPERTFWEKATILHKEACRTNGTLPSRYSRHYYDLFCMNQSNVKALAFADFDLLASVVRFKNRFYPTGSAHYELAKPGTFRLMPPERSIQLLQSDYEHMKNMIYGNQPSFEEILACLQSMEEEINANSQYNTSADYLSC
ncbi:MAG: nucleotidyl transferase AbiEii/AbiGii toxin family protein [Clostridia bacterium]